MDILSKQTSDDLENIYRNFAGFRMSYDDIKKTYRKA